MHSRRYRSIRWVAAALVASTVTVAVVATLSGPRAGARNAFGAERAVTPGVAESGPRPNIVVVMADDMRSDDVRFMPAVRKLVASQGLTFRNSFSPYPLCCPARASFLTGQYAHNHGVLNNEPPFGFAGLDDRRTIATSLASVGYRTAFVGKYLNGYGKNPSPVTGEPSMHYVPPGWTDWYAAVGLRPRVGQRFPWAGVYNYWGTPFNDNGALDFSHRGDYQTNVLGAVSRSLVARYARSAAPFFLYLSSVAPHYGFPHERGDIDEVRRGDRVFPFKSPARPNHVRGRFDETVTRAPGLPLSGPSESDMSDKAWWSGDPELNTLERLADLKLTRQRAESLAVLDRQVRLLVRQLRTTGELANTVFVFTSDNGYFLGEHRIRNGKIRPYEPSLRVPLVVAGPGVPHGVRYDPATTIDLTSTLLDLANANPPVPADGRSLVPSFASDRGWTTAIVTEALDGGPPVPPGVDREALGFSDLRTQIGLRTAQWKLIRYDSGDVELYDLDADPNELESVADDPALEEVLAELLEVWHSLRSCLGTTCVTPLPSDLQLGASALAESTESQRAGVRARYGVAF
ncbi:MAG TPA: sulfatase [Nocardioidaceae bacterium]|nr:sulfatase [Nocardioidaceae bacterium]